MITVNMTKAKEIWRDKIRKDRIAKMAELDVAFMRAQETGDLAAIEEVAAKKQLWRDAPSNPAISAATTINELKAAYPAE
jgi:hypothetical protein